MFAVMFNNLIIKPILAASLILLSSLLWAQQAFQHDAFKVVTYNLHGGHGNAEYNLQRFNELLDGDEHVLCLQEIKPDIWPLVQDVFIDYPYSQIVWRQTTDALGLFESPQKEGGAIFSKLPFLSVQERLVQIDPAGDMWERKAGFVTVQGGQTLDDEIFIGCYHNTYNFDDDDFASEQAGMRKFRDISLEEMGITALDVNKPYVLAGDFNLYEDKVSAIMNDVPFHYSVWRDHIVSNIPMLNVRQINAVEQGISDHDALLVTLDIDVSNRPTSDESEIIAPSQPATESAGIVGINGLFMLIGLMLLIQCPRKKPAMDKIFTQRTL